MKWLIHQRVLSAVLLVPQVASAQKPQTIDLNVNASTVLDALVTVALEHRIPMGLEVKDLEPLCATRQNFDVKGASIEEAFRQITKGTGYQVVPNRGTFDVVDPKLNIRQVKALKYIYPTFPGGNTLTMNGIGIRLTGWVQMLVENLPTYAASVHPASAEQRIPLGTLSNVNTEQIANQVVTFKGSGLWFTKESQIGSSRYDEIVIYSYEYDSAMIKAVGCGTFSR